MIGWKLSQGEILNRLLEENSRGNKKFQEFAVADTEAFVRILGEEFGEICEALNKDKDSEEVVKEIIQVMSVCYRFLSGELRDGNL